MDAGQVEASANNYHGNMRAKTSWDILVIHQWRVRGAIATQTEVLCKNLDGTGKNPL